MRIASSEKSIGREPGRHVFGGRYCLYDFKNQTKTNLIDGGMWVHILTVTCTQLLIFYPGVCLS